MAHALWGHLTAVHDAMLPLLGLRERLHPEFDVAFISNPDRSRADIPSPEQVRMAWSAVNAELWNGFEKMSSNDWVLRHSAVSEEDFAKDPSRNYPRGFVPSIMPVGAVNLTNIHPTLDLQLSRRLSTYVDLDAFWRTRNTDGIYDSGGGLIRTAFSTPSRYIGLQPSGELDWYIGRYVRAELAYAHFFPGPAITRSGPRLPINYVLPSTTFTFKEQA